MKLVIAAMVASTAIVLAAPAHADTDDTAYLNALHQQGISDDNGDQGLVKFGHMVCGALAEGYSENALIGIGDLHGTRLSSDGVRVLVKSAEAAYCPQYIK